MARGGLQILLGSLGITLNPEEVERDVKAMIQNVNATAAFIQSVDARLSRIEMELGIENSTSLVETKPNGSAAHDGN